MKAKSITITLAAFALLLFCTSNVYTQQAKLLWNQKSNNFSFNPLAYSSDGKFLITTGQGNAGTGNMREIEEWNAETGTLINSFPFLEDIDMFNLSSDGSRLLCEIKNCPIPKLNEYDLMKKKFIKMHEFKVSDEAFKFGIISALSYYKDTSKIIVFYSIEHKLEVYRSGDDQLDFELNLGDKDINSVDLSKNGTLAAIAYSDSTIGIWNVETGQKIITFNNGFAADFIKISADGQHLFASQSVSSGDKPLKIYHLFPFEIMQILYLPNSDNFGAISYSGNYFLSFQHSWTEPVVFKTDDDNFKLNFDKITWGSSFVCSPVSDQAAFYDNSGQICIANIETGALIRTFSRFPSKNHAGSVTDVKFTSDGKYLATAGEDGSVKFWNLSDGAFWKSIDISTAGVNSIDFSPGGGSLACGSGNGNIYIYNAENYQLNETKKSLFNNISKIEWVPKTSDPTMVYSGGSSGIAFCRAGDELPGILIDSSIKRISSFNFSRNGIKLIAGGKDRHFKIWGRTDSSYDKWEELADNFLNFISPTNGISSVSFCDNDQKMLLLCGDDNYILKMDAINYYFLSYINAKDPIHQNGTFLVMTVNNIGDKVFSGDAAGYVRIYDIPSGRCLTVLDTLNPNEPSWNKITAITLSQDERLLAASDNSGAISLYDISDFHTGVNDDKTYENNGILIYPNPAESSFNITFKPIKTGLLKIVLCDALGNNISELENTYTSFSEYSRRFEIKQFGLSVGIYFIKIENGESFSIKKIIICK